MRLLIICITGFIVCILIEGALVASHHHWWRARLPSSHSSFLHTKFPVAAESSKLRASRGSDWLLLFLNPRKVLQHITDTCNILNGIPRNISTNHPEQLPVRIRTHT